MSWMLWWQRVGLWRYKSLVLVTNDHIGTFINLKHLRYHLSIRLLCHLKVWLKGSEKINFDWLMLLPCIFARATVYLPFYPLQRSGTHNSMYSCTTVLSLVCEKSTGLEWMWGECLLLSTEMGREEDAGESESRPGMQRAVKKASPCPSNEASGAGRIKRESRLLTSRLKWETCSSGRRLCIAAVREDSQPVAHHLPPKRGLELDPLPPSCDLPNQCHSTWSTGPSGHSSSSWQCHSSFPVTTPAIRPIHSAVSIYFHSNMVAIHRFHSPLNPCPCQWLSLAVVSHLPLAQLPL